jgi:hypothetical protein
LDYWIWFVNVKFPKETTHLLTQAEKDKFNGMIIENSNGMLNQLIFDDAYNTVKIPDTAFVVHTQNSKFEVGVATETEFYEHTRGIRTIIRYSNGEQYTYEKCVLYNLVIGKSMLFMTGKGEYVRTSPVTIVDFK